MLAESGAGSLARRARARAPPRPQPRRMAQPGAECALGCAHDARCTCPRFDHTDGRAWAQVPRFLWASPWPRLLGMPPPQSPCRREPRGLGWPGAKGAGAPGRRQGGGGARRGRGRGERGPRGRGRGRRGEPRAHRHAARHAGGLPPVQGARARARAACPPPLRGRPCAPSARGWPRRPVCWDGGAGQRVVPPYMLRRGERCRWRGPDSMQAAAPACRPARPPCRARVRACRGMRVSVSGCRCDLAACMRRAPGALLRQQSARAAAAQEAQQGAEGQAQGLRDRIAALERQLAAQQVPPSVAVALTRAGPCMA